MDNKIFITDENGREYEMNILFTFNNNDVDYVVVYPTENSDDLYAFKYDLEGTLIEIEDEEEINMVNEVISAFEEDIENVA